MKVTAEAGQNNAKVQGFLALLGLSQVAMSEVSAGVLRRFETSPLSAAAGTLRDPGLAWTETHQNLSKARAPGWQAGYRQ